MKRPVYQIRNYSFRIGGKEILKEISFIVEEGQYLCVIGPNGAGKTTLLKCMNGIYSGGSGDIEIRGKPLPDYRRKDLAKEVSYVPQAGERLFPFSVREFVLLGRYPYLSPFTAVGKTDREAADEALAATGMEEFGNRPIGTLSGGERQKVFIAAALVQGAGVLLLDEPTTFLDPRHAVDILDIIARLNSQSGVTVVSVTHDINAAVLYSDRVIALREGTLAYDGSPQGVMDNRILSGIYGMEFLFGEHPRTGARIVVPEGGSSG